jgi:hypothetical protein
MRLFIPLPSRYKAVWPTGTGFNRGLFGAFRGLF